MKNRDCYPVNSGYLTRMDTSVKALEEAISIRRQIDTLERRLSSILGGRALPTTTTTTTRPAGARYFSPSTRAKLAAAAKARWARLRGPAPRAGSHDSCKEERPAHACRTKKALPANEGSLGGAEEIRGQESSSCQEKRRTDACREKEAF